MSSQAETYFHAEALFPKGNVFYERNYLQYVDSLSTTRFKDFAKLQNLFFREIGILERQEKNGIRFYLDPADYEMYASITAVLSISSDHTWLDTWKLRVGEENAARTSRVSSNRGTQLHSLCENYLRGDYLFVNREDGKDKEIYMPESIQMFKSLIPLLNRIESVNGTEARMLSRKLRIAGTADCIAEFDGVASIIDFKNSKREKTLEQISDYILQETAYAIMAKETFGVSIKQLVTIIAIEGKMNPQLFVVELKQNHVEELLKRIEVFKKYVNY